jgi:hypothetical protein
MDRSNNFFVHQNRFLQVLSMRQTFFTFSNRKLEFLLNFSFNFLFGLFWHFIVIHLAIFQTQTIILNFDKNLEDFIDYVMIGGIYINGYFGILCYYQINSRKLTTLMDFINKNFRQRSHKGLERKSKHV